MFKSAKTKKLAEKIILGSVPHFDNTDLKKDFLNGKYKPGQGKNCNH